MRTRLHVSRRRVIAMAGALPAIAALSACAAQSRPDPSTPQARPDDFRVEYRWSTGTIPPPHAYHYQVLVEANGNGMIVMKPDYVNAGPQWQETFTVTKQQLNATYTLLTLGGLFDERWAADEEPVGGGSEQVSVIANGQSHVLPSIVKTNKPKAASMRAAIAALVPAAVLEKLETQRAQWAATQPQ
jgi:hypothetical protein